MYSNAVERYGTRLRNGELLKCKNTTKLCAAAGALVLTQLAYNIGSWFWFHYGFSTNLSKYGANKGAYVVITGASDGIGRGLALEAAKRGFNLVLISRNTGDSLTSLAKEILNDSSLSSIDVKTITLDCSVDEPQTYETILSVVRDLPVTILINNVGSANDNSSGVALDNQSVDVISRIITLNATFLTKLTSMLIPLLASSAQRLACRGCVVTVSSYLSILPAGYYTVYSSTKAYVNQFVECLATELPTTHPNLDVCNIIPAGVCSKMSQISEPSATVPAAETFAKHVWNKIGKNLQIMPFVPHAIMGVLSNHIMPRWFVRKSIGEALRPKQQV